MHSPADTVLRAGKSLAIHLIFAGVLYGLLMLWVGSYDSAAEAMREQYEEAEILNLLAGTRSTLSAWFMGSLAIGWACSALFLLLANMSRQSVRSTADARKAMPAWIVLFVVDLAATVVLWWALVSRGDVATMLVDSNYLLLVSAGHIAAALAFWLGTGLSVALTLKPSVPVASTLQPDFWN